MKQSEKETDEFVILLKTVTPETVNDKFEEYVKVLQIKGYPPLSKEQVLFLRNWLDTFAKTNETLNKLEALYGDKLNL